MRSTIFWDVTPCSLAEFYRRIIWRYCFSLQDQSVCQVRKQTNKETGNSKICLLNWRIRGIFLSGTLINRQTTRNNAPEDGALLNVNLFIISVIIPNKTLYFPCLRQENRINGRGDSLRWPRDILYSQKLALSSPTSGGRSVGIVRLRTKGPGERQ
jgi:hypothetical protein